MMIHCISKEASMGAKLFFYFINNSIFDKDLTCKMYLCLHNPDAPGCCPFKFLGGDHAAVFFVVCFAKMSKMVLVFCVGSCFLGRCFCGHSNVVIIGSWLLNFIVL